MFRGSWQLTVVIALACSLNTARQPTVALDTRPPNPTCVAPPRPATRARVVRAYPNVQLEQPVAIAGSPDGAWWYVAERRGRVWRFAMQDDAATAELVLDMVDRVNSKTGAIGLLAIAIDPEFERTGALFASYTGFGGPVVVSRLSRFVSRDGGSSFDAASEERLLEIDQHADYHVNADVRFGPDGYLYAGFGDGGPQGDPMRKAQDPYSLRGKILRIDVRAIKHYRIPPDNPFAKGGGRPEVWALGFRNPWRFAFDRDTGELWVGDVGADHFDEIDRVVRGGNYGWNMREGTRCADPARCRDPALIEPIVALAHPTVSSITFGLAYRGGAIPSLRGHLLYADYASGVLWEVEPADRIPRMLDSDGHAIVSFAEDAAGEPLLLDLSGTLWRVVAGSAGPSDVPEMLSATGCFSRRGVPAAGLVPYEINVPFWSDGASKRRWFAIPDGKSIHVDAEGRLDLPVGSVVAKEFAVGGLRVETRLLVRHDDGGWAGYTYRWDASQSDATLLAPSSAGTTTTWPMRWYFPHRGECIRCHQPAAGHTLGLAIDQLRRPSTTGGDQVALFSRLGLITDAPDAQPLPSAGTVEQRARAWLHANCAYCHQPGASGLGEMDLRYTTPLAQTGLCNVPPRFGTFGEPNARLVVPGNPRLSMLSRRIRATWFIRMPPLGTVGYDANGAALVDEWIERVRCNEPR